MYNLKKYRFVFYVLCVVAVVVSVGVGCRPVAPGAGGGGGTAQGCTTFDAPCDQGPELVIYSENADGVEWPNTIMDFFGGYASTITSESLGTGGAGTTTTFLSLTPTDAQDWAAGGWSRQADITQTVDVSLYDTLKFSYRIVSTSRLGLEMKMESGTPGECQNVPIALNKDDTWREVTLGLKQFTNPVLYGGGRNGNDGGEGRTNATCSLDVDLTDASALLVYNLLDTGDGDTSTVDPGDGTIHLDEVQLVKSGDTTAPAAVVLDTSGSLARLSGVIDIRITLPMDSDLDGYRVTYMEGTEAAGVPPNCDDGAPNLRFISSVDADSNVLTTTGLTPGGFYGFRICSEDLTGNYHEGLVLTNEAAGT